jgi:hypothetical protein
MSIRSDPPGIGEPRSPASGVPPALSLCRGLPDVHAMNTSAMSLRHRMHRSSDARISQCRLRSPSPIPPGQPAPRLSGPIVVSVSEKAPRPSRRRGPRAPRTRTRARVLGHRAAAGRDRRQRAAGVATDPRESRRDVACRASQRRARRGRTTGARWQLEVEHGDPVTGCCSAQRAGARSSWSASGATVRWSAC